METWLNSKDKDVRWLMKQNLKKNRLVHMDADWVRQCAASLGNNPGIADLAKGC